MRTQLQFLLIVVAGWMSRHQQAVIEYFQEENRILLEQLGGKTHLIIDRDTKYVDAFRHTLESAGVKIVLCPPRVPQRNAFAERFVRLIKEECLSCLIFLNERHLRTTIATFADNYRQRRNH